jgi:hypothetical protein
MKQLIETIESLRLRGIGFRSLTEAIDTTTAQGVLVFHMFKRACRVRARSHSERARAGLAAAKRLGRTGGRPAKMTEHDLDVAKTLLANPISLSRTLPVDSVFPRQHCTDICPPRASHNRSLHRIRSGCCRGLSPVQRAGFPQEPRMSVRLQVALRVGQRRRRWDGPLSTLLLPFPVGPDTEGMRQKADVGGTRRLRHNRSFPIARRTG